MIRCIARRGVALALCLVAGCASRSIAVKPLPTDAAAYAGWTCDRIDDELDAVQQRAAEVAYALDERVGTNIVALGVGIAVFWPALLAMRGDGPEADELAQLKGRDAALRETARAKRCPPPSPELPPARAAAWPLAIGERLVYEQRANPRAPASEWMLTLVALRRDEAEFRLDERGRPAATWRQDSAGNVTQAPSGALVWPRLLPREPALGQVLAGHFDIGGDTDIRARMRGQVVAIGPQQIAGRRFDVVVIELFGDVQTSDPDTTRVDGAIVVDRASGVLLRLDLNSASPSFNLRRRLARIDAP